MMRSNAIIAAALASLVMLASMPAALAQQFSAGPDMGTYQARSVTYAAGNAPNTLGDGSNAKGGIAPAFTSHPEPVENFTIPAGWTIAGATQCVVSPTGPCYEKKIRSHAEASHFAFVDPMRYWGQPEASHCHEFFGNRATNAWTTRLSTQVRRSSTAAGGEQNATAYWEPCWIKTINGLIYAIPASINTFYYVQGVPAGSVMTDNLQNLHELLGFVSGVNVDDFDDIKVKNEIAAANAQPGTGGRYEYAGNGFAGYACLLSNGNQAAIKGGLSHSPGFTLADGTDPWEGRCVAGSEIYAESTAPGCWDGWNVRSPSGYDHFRHAILDTYLNTSACPLGWYMVPELALKTSHITQGWDDYKLWSLASDAMVAAKLGRQIVPGASFHNDWLNGWNKTMLSTWLRECLGIGTNQPRECNDSAMSNTTSLLLGGPTPDGRPRQITFGKAVNSNDPTQLHLVSRARGSHIQMRGM